MANLALPENLESPGWLTALHSDKQEPITDTLHSALNSAAHRERWKYTKADAFLAATSTAATEPTVSGHEQAGITITRAPITEPMPGFDIEQAPEAFARLCYATNVLTIDVTGLAATPMLLNHTASTLPILIRVADNATLTLTETTSSSEAAQQSIWINLGNNARVRHSRNALDNAPSHWQYLNVRLQSNANYQLNNHVTGCGSRRQDIHVIMDGQGAEANLVSAGKVDGKAALDQQVTLEHRQPRGSSNQTLHNIVANGGKCTFNGRIHIHKGAFGTDAQLSNKNLGMGEHATINSKPELEIYTDDVSCSHGATIGTISKDALFYLTSRGIDQAAAEALLSQGFLRQCIDGPLANQALNTMIGGESARS